MQTGSADQLGAPSTGTCQSKGPGGVRQHVVAALCDVQALGESCKKWGRCGLRGCSWGLSSKALELQVGELELWVQWSRAVESCRCWEGMIM